jgi:hypothetical protein
MRYLYWPGLVLAACLLVLILFPLAEKTYRSVYGAAASSAPPRSASTGRMGSMTARAISS